MIKSIKLDSGTILVYEQLPHLRSVCTGIWVQSGSRYENSENNGISHFLEHMLFKGTETLSAKDIADQFDSIGGIINGFTSKEATCYYSKTLDEHFDESFEVLVDMVQNYSLNPAMIEKEKKVVAEEISMYADSPEDFVHDMMEREMWKNDPLGYPVIGTRESLASIDRAMLIDYAQQRMSSNNTVIAVAGNFNEKTVVQTVTKHFNDREKADKIKQSAFEKPKFYPSNNRYKKDIEQTYISIGFESEGYGGPNRYALMAATTILGGGMSSRLFQNLREDKGLVYSVGAINQSYSNAGIINIYAGTGEKEMDQALECIKKEVDNIRQSGVTDEEVNRAREQIKGNFILGMENTSSRMMYMGRNILLKGYVDSQDEIVKKIDAITKQDINAISEKTLKWDKAAISILSSIKNKD